MKGLAHGGLSPNSGSRKMNGVAAWRTGSVLLLGSWERDGLGWAMHGELSHSEILRKQPLVSRDGQEKWESEAAWREGSQKG